MAASHSFGTEDSRYSWSLFGVPAAALLAELSFLGDLAGDLEGVLNRDFGAQFLLAGEEKSLPLLMASFLGDFLGECRAWSTRGSFFLGLRAGTCASLAITGSFFLLGDRVPKRDF